MVPKKKSDGKKQEEPLVMIRKRIAQAPQSPGVYRWLDKEGNVLYIGKAKNLRNRLRSYVQEGQKHSPWKDMMVRQIRDFDTTVVNSDLEAIVLETNLIKEFKPKYNIMMKDDKHYVYVRITTKDQYPRIDVVRKMEDDGSLYFGPKTSAEQVRTTLAFLRKLFPFRTCTMEIEVKEPPAKQGIPLAVNIKHRDRPTPCLDHHIKQCCAPCIGKVTPNEYRELAINGVIAFFSGKQEQVEHVVMQKMKEAAEAKKFERAAELRDQLQSLKAMREKQLASDTSGANADIIGVALHTGRANVVVLRQRDGKLLSEENFSLQGNADDACEVLDQFLPQYYLAASDLPDQIILSDEPNEREGIALFLSEKRGRKVDLLVPQRGNKSALLLLAEKNAAWKAQQSEAKWESDARRVTDALSGLQEALKLPASPRRIEGYDISHLGGTETVGSMTVMIDGRPRRDHYRSFTIRSLKPGAIDDYASLKETLSRRLTYLAKKSIKEEEKAWKENGVLFGKVLTKEKETFEKLIRGAGADSANVPPKECLVARAEGSIIGCVCLRKHPKNTGELSLVWIDPEKAKNGLSQFLIRKILATRKKGKVYVVTDASHEGFYGDLRFSVIHKAPPLLQSALETRRKAHGDALVMMYEARSNVPDPSFSDRPDLLLIDGGKGQLGVVVNVLRDLNLSIPVASLAKREEEIFTPGNSFPVDLPKNSSAQFLLQRLRDEAHRFANSLREKKGLKAVQHSVLDDIAGIGPLTRQKLQKKFPTISSLKNADDEALRRILSEEQLRALRAALAK